MVGSTKTKLHTNFKIMKCYPMAIETTTLTQKEKENILKYSFEGLF